MLSCKGQKGIQGAHRCQFQGQTSHSTEFLQALLADSENLYQPETVGNDLSRKNIRLEEYNCKHPTCGNQKTQKELEVMGPSYRAGCKEDGGRFIRQKSFNVPQFVAK